MKPNQKILFLEHSGSDGKSVGGSFYSLLGMLELFPELRGSAIVSFYFDNHVAESIRKLGFEVRILNHFKLGKFTTWLKRNRLKLGSKSSQSMAGEVSYSFLESIWQYYVAVSNSFEIARLIKTSGITVVYCNRGVNLDRAGIIAAIITGRRICCHLRGIPKLNAMDKLLARKVNLFIAISDAVFDHYQNELAGQTILIRRIYNPIGKVFEEKSAKLLAETDQVQRSEIVRVACFSRIIWWKGQENLINAFKHFLNHGGEAELFIYGNGPDRERLESLVSDLDMPSKVTFKGYAKDVVAEMLAVDIIVNPSIRPEPLGRVIMEGMLLRRAVIATNIGGPTELIENGVDGLLVSANDKGSIAKALHYLCDNHTERNRMGRRARGKALANWNANVAKSQFQSAFRDLGICLSLEADKRVE